MMCDWTEENIRFMRDAAAYGTYYPSLAQKLLDYLPAGGRICDAGCGLGDLSLALAPFFREVTACDVSERAIAELRCRIDGKNVRVLCGDIAKNLPETPYDGMVFLLFSAPQLVLETAAKQCRGAVCVVSRGRREHRFSVDQQPLHSDSGSALERELQDRRISFQKETWEMEFGQPFRNYQEAERFFTLYNREKRKPSRESVRKRLVRTGREDFPLYAPEKKTLQLLCFDSRDLGEIN